MFIDSVPILQQNNIDFCSTTVWQRVVSEFSLLQFWISGTFKTPTYSNNILKQN